MADAQNQSSGTGSTNDSSAISQATVVSGNPQPDWTMHRSIFDRVRVTVGDVDRQYWPGGGNLGCVSAITGAVELPATANSSVDGAIPTIIITAGVSGLAQSFSSNQTGVGVFGMARMGTTQARVWGANFVAGNRRESDGTNGPGYHGQINGIEIDCGWWQPSTPVGGSNMIGLWMPAEFYGGRPDGSATAIQVGRYADFGWKEMLKSDHGGADTFAQIGMIKALDAAGPSGAQPLHFISSAGGQKTSGGDTNDYRHTYLNVAPGGDVLLQPNYYGSPGSLIVANNNLTQTCRINPQDGFSGPRGTFTELGITGNATVNGTIVSGTFATGTFNVTGDGSFGGNATVNGLMLSSSVQTGYLNVTGNGRVSGNLEVVSALYVPNFMFFQGKQVILAPDGNNIPPGYKALIVAA